MSIEDGNVENFELEILQLEEEDGSIVDAIVIADMEMDGQCYVALQVFDEDSTPEELEIILAKLSPDPNDEDFEIVEFLDEGEEFDKVAAAFEEAFESVEEENGEE